MHDNVLQCSMWNMINYPFCLCDCLKGHSDIYLDHVCTFITDKYHVGGETILSTDYAGVNVSFYSHCVRLYLPKIAKVTLEKHIMGLFTFIMQVFEHQNKEYKECFVKFTNKKRNICIQVMK